MSRRRTPRLVVDLYDALQLLEQYVTREEALDALTHKAFFAYHAPDLIDHISMMLRHPICYVRYYVRKRTERRPGDD